MLVKAIRKNLSESNQIKVISYYHFNVNDNTALLLILVRVVLVAYVPAIIFKSIWW